MQQVRKIKNVNRLDNDIVFLVLNSTFPFIYLYHVSYFSHVVIVFFSVVEIPIEHSSSYNKIFYDTSVFFFSADGVALGAAVSTSKTEVEVIVFVAIMLHKVKKNLL